MFNYLFPIFCFGLLVTGIVFLGILQAAEHLNAESARLSEGQTRNHDLETTASRSNTPPRSMARNSHE